MTSVVTAAGTSVTTWGTAVGEAEGLLARLVSDGVPAALAAKNPHLWGPDAVQAARRGLGWVDAPNAPGGLLERIAEVRGRFGDCDRVVLAGTGDATRAAAVISDRLTVLDTTDPHQVGRALAGPLDRTVAVLVGDPTALETDAHHRILAAAFRAAGIDPATRIVIITDPGPPPDTADGGSVPAPPFGPEPRLAAEPDLTADPRHVTDPRLAAAPRPGAEPGLAEQGAALAAEPRPGAEAGAGARFAGTEFEAGGGARFGALSAFGLVPAALAGADAGALIEQAAEFSLSFAQPYRNPALTLGAALGAAVLAGRDTLVLRTPPQAPVGAARQGAELTALAGWIEQLLAASLGKDGKGILPVVVGTGDNPSGHDLFRVSLHGPGQPSRGPDQEPRDGRDVDLAVSGPLGAQFLLWEYATAVAGRIIGVNPFDRPDVAEAAETITALLRAGEDGVAPTVVTRPPAFVDGPVEVYGPADLLKGVKDLDGAIEAITAAIPDDGYLAVMAYLDAIGDAPAALLRSSLATRTRGRPVTFGWAPRCLHGTGQFHKGGPRTGTFLQITGAVTTDVAVPGRPYTLRALQLAQAFGDLRLLASLGRPALRLHLRDRTTGLQRLRRVFSPLASGAV